VQPSDNSELSQKKQSEDIIRINFTLIELADIRIGDYIEHTKAGVIYTLNKRPRVTESPKNYQYECIFEGPIHELRKTKIFLITPKQTGYYKDYKFSLTGNAQTFLSFIVDNLNRNSTGYSVGSYTPTGMITVNFNNWNALEAITELSNLLLFSWYLEGKKLHFTTKTTSTSYVLQVGKLKGFTQLTRIRIDSQDTVTCVYGYGATSNLPPRIATPPQITYDSSLLTENRLSFVGVGGESKLEKNIALFGRIETVQEFDISPEKTGSITGINSGDLRIFTDTSIEFDIEAQKIQGIKPKITFLTGSLIGLTFDISFVFSTKTVTMDYYSDESGQYPNSVIKANIGDQYKLFDIIMPQSYLTDAESRLKDATQAYLDSNSSNIEVYEGTIDEYYIRANSMAIFLGDFIRIVSATFAIDNLYEVKELVQGITNPYKYTIKFGDVLPKSLLSSLKSINFANKQEIYNINKNTYTINESNNQITNILGQDLTWQDL